jgi:hypothetical protein
MMIGSITPTGDMAPQAGEEARLPMLIELDRGIR